MPKIPLPPPSELPLPSPWGNAIEIVKAKAESYARKKAEELIRRQIENIERSVRDKAESIKKSFENKKISDPCQKCSVVNDPKKMKDCVQEGDIVLRQKKGDTESDLIANLSKDDYSHAGIVTRNQNGDLVVVDAYPGRGTDNSNAVGEISVEEFFNAEHATSGGVFRYENPEVAKKAAEWAMQQTQSPDYTFDIYDPWNENPKNVYCSDFVSQAFENAGVTLVEEKIDFLSDANRANTAAAFRKFKPLLTLKSDDRVISLVKEKTGMTSGEFIAPGQLAKAKGVKQVTKFDPKSKGCGNK